MNRDEHIERLIEKYRENLEEKDNEALLGDALEKARERKIEVLVEKYQEKLEDEEDDELLPAGQICPTAKPYSLDPNAKPVDVIPEDQWSPGMKNIAEYARFLADELMGVKLSVAVVRTLNAFAACYGKGRLDLNLQRLGHRWFEQGATEEVDRLLIHEFGHHFSGDHLSEEYHEGLCRLGAGLKKLALEKPDALRRFGRRQPADE